VNVRDGATAVRHRLGGHGVTKIMLAAAGAAALTTTIMGGPAGATSGITGIGSPACATGWAGRMNFTPPLKTGGTATSEEISLTARFNCSGGSPPPAPPPTAGKYAGKGIVTMAGANDCANFFAAYPGPFPVVNFTATAHLDGDVAWAPAGINQSNVNFASMQIFTGTAGRLLIKLPAPPGSGVVVGSYTPAAKLSLRTFPASYAAAAAACGTASGLSTLTIVASNGGGPSHGTW
jgi:hypothetical protein